MPDDIPKPYPRTPPAPLVPQSLGGWLRPIGTAALTAFGFSGRARVAANSARH